MLRLEQLPRWLRVPVRAAFYALAVCLVVSLLPVWRVWDAHPSAVHADAHGLFWEEVGSALFGDWHSPGVHLVHNLEVMAAVAGLAFLVGVIGFWFGPRVKDKEDEPRRLRRTWEPRHSA